MAERDADPPRPKVEWPDEPGIFDLTPEEERRRNEAALTEVRAGRFISHEAVMAWLKDLSEGKRRPRPQVGE